MRETAVKSTDGGKSWQNMGLRRSLQIGRIAIHPQNPDVVYVGALGRLWGPNEERRGDVGEHLENHVARLDFNPCIWIFNQS